MKVHLSTLVFVSAIAVGLGVVIHRDLAPLFPFIADVPQQVLPDADVTSPIETIFLALDREQISVPVTRAGSGGALASFGNDLILMTHEGRFFEVSGDLAQPIDVVAPDNGWDAMLEFEAQNPDYTFAHFYFRYNDVEVFDGALFVSFTEWVADQSCYRTTIATAPMGGASGATELDVPVGSWEILFATDPCLPPKQVGRAIDGHMAGGRFTISEDGILYLASGDYAVDGTYSDQILSQNPTAAYGKVIAVDIETGDVEVLSQGHSNMQGIVIDDDDNLFTVEHGRRGGDELNLIVAGQDYGWPQVSLGTRYNRLPLQGSLDYGRHTGFQAPVYAWLPSVAISSITKIDDFHPSWDGDLMAGSLAAGMLFRIRIEDGRVLFDERIEIGARIRDVLQHRDQFVLWTDQKDIIRLSVGEFDLSTQFAYDKIVQLGLSDLQEQRVELALDQCAECHGFGVIASPNAPALGRVFNADIGAGAFAYSDALLSRSGAWTRDALTAYLQDPQQFAPGTTMPNPELNDPEVIAALVDIMEALRLQPE